MQARLTTKPHHDVIAALQALDLESVKSRVMDAELGQGWTRDYADSIEIAYKNYLTMLVKYPEDAADILLSKDVDEFWHTHILQTMKYAEDCQNVFGNFLHHNPHIGERTPESAQKRAAASEKTRRLYLREFGDPQAADTAWGGKTVKTASNPAYCEATAAKMNVAYCEATAARTRAAYCEATAGAAKAAYCEATIHSGSAAYCEANGRAAKAAYCEATAGAGKAAYCEATIRNGNAAYCEANVRAAKAAYCEATTAPPTAAYCEATIRSGSAAYCEAAVRTANAAYCEATAGAGKAAYCEVGVQAAKFRDQEAAMR